MHLTRPWFDPRWLALALCAGCFRLPDDYINDDLYLAMDYELTRPRLIGVRLDPPYVVSGQPNRIVPLFAGPAEPVFWEAEICGLRDDVRVQVRDTFCFREEELVRPVTDAKDPIWQVPEFPDISRDGCHVGGLTLDVDVSCASYAPMRIRGEFDDGSEAWGGTQVPILVLPPDTKRPSLEPIAAAGTSLTFSGVPRAGGEVDLTFRIDLSPAWIDWRDVRWFVDAGELLETSRTSADDMSAFQVTTSNRLRIPDDYAGDLTVYVVVEGNASASPGYVGDMTWTSLTLDVRP